SQGHRAMRLHHRESRPDNGRLRSARQRSVAPVELLLQQPERAKTFTLLGAAHYGLPNILIGGIASNHMKSSIPPLSRIPVGNDTAKVTGALLFSASFDF